mmetsp:Transcript_23601/g.58511  ORF Transcript_23601/g.58511 Transcript_23601/m.58511 type:complete len:220 (+) Transcript_23601:1304-1963(+)
MAAACEGCCGEGKGRDAGRAGGAREGATGGNRCREVASPGETRRVRAEDPRRRGVGRKDVVRRGRPHGRGSGEAQSLLRGPDHLRENGVQPDGEDPGGEGDRCVRRRRQQGCLGARADGGGASGRRGQVFSGARGARGRASRADRGAQGRSSGGGGGGQGGLRRCAVGRQDCRRCRGQVGDAGGGCRQEYFGGSGGQVRVSRAGAGGGTVRGGRGIRHG